MLIRDCAGFFVHFLLPLLGERRVVKESVPQARLIAVFNAVAIHRCVGSCALPSPQRTLYARMGQVRLETGFAESGRARHALKPKGLDVSELENEITGVVPRLARHNVDVDGI